MADHTSFAQRSCSNTNGPRCAVALEAGLVLACKSSAAALERLDAVGSAAFDRVSLVRVMTIDAAYLSFQHRVVIRQFECRAHFQMALETCLGRLARVDDCVRRSAAFNVKTSGSMTGLATDVLGVVTGRF